MWDFGTAVEACIALAKPESALRWLERYLAAPYSDAFELASTLHQFTAVWQLDVQSQPGSSVLPLLRAHLLARSGGSLDVTRQELTTYQHASVDVMYEKVLGDDSYKTYKWYMTGAQRCLLVARIGRDATQGFGTGFVVKGSDISPTFGDDLVLVTNAHVVTDDVAVRKAHKALPPEEAVITFEALGPEEYRIDKVLFTSRPEELDATVLKLENAKALNDKLRDKAARLARALPLVEESARIYIIGHPRGGTLSLSMADNALLDHEDPRIHYRTPTDEGSSGSPIFNRQWELIGLHHAGGENMARLNKKPGTYAANEGIWLNAIVKAIAGRPG
jgi:V8-like Glu-specific endopeptidase